MNIFKMICFFTLISFNSNSVAEILTPEQVLQKVIDHYPAVNRAAIEVERARQSIKIASGHLVWQLSAQSGFERGIGLFGTSSDAATLGIGIARTLESGSSIALDAGVKREESKTVFSPTIPNPATSSNIGLSYRQHLSKNTSSSSYQASKISAQIDLESSLSETDAMYDQLASKVFDLYFSTASLQARINNIDQSIERSKRLQLSINNKASLGVSEEKDILQVNAQVNALIAEKSNFKTIWMQQLVAINRLMESPWDSAITTTYKINKVDDTDGLYLQAKKYSPAIRLMDSKLSLADSQIRIHRDERKNDIDLILFAGTQSYKGDTNLGSASESELVGGIRLEYKQTMNKKAVDAKLYQAQLERNMVLLDRKQLLENLNYDLFGLLAEIKSNTDAFEIYKKSLSSEKIKVAEAMQRYRSGRIDTDVLIMFEGQLTQAKLALELQRISLAHRYYKLQVMLGAIWKKIKKPINHDFTINFESSGNMQ